MEDIIDIIVTETTNLIEITSQPTDEIIDVNIIDNREDVTLNVTPSVVEININSLTGNFGILWGEIEGTLSNQTDLQNALNLKADLVDGKVPSSQLPSYVDDVVEVANYAALPVTGEVGKIYITLDTNYIYRWTGSTYVEIKDSSAVWGAITGTLSNQTDLQNALNAKLNLSGGTLTGALTGTSITLSNSLNFTNIYGGNINGYDGTSFVPMNYSASQHQYYSDGTLKMMLLGNGNLLLGTTTDNGSKLQISGTATFSSSVTASSIIKSGGTSSQFLKADGSVDSSTYALDSAVVKLTGNQTIAGTKTFSDGTYHDYGLLLKQGTSTNASGYTGIAGTSTGLSIGVGTPNYSNLVFSTSAIYTYTFPNATGTLALTSDLSSYLPLSGGTLTGNLFLPDNNTVGGTNYYIGQQMASNDYWRIYGNTVGSDQAEMIFDIGDNGGPFASGGQRFRFFYSAGADGTPKSPLTIDYDTSTFTTALVGTSATFSGALSGTSATFSGALTGSNGVFKNPGASPNNTLFIQTSDYASGSAGSVLRLGHVATTGNTTAIIQNLTNGGTAAGNISFPEGNVGIGTTSPAGKLSLYDTSDVWINISRSSSFVNIGVDSTGTFYNTNSNHRWLYNSGGNEAMRITSVGFLGVNQTSPAQRLDVNGAIRSGVGISNGAAIAKAIGRTLYKVIISSNYDAGGAVRGGEWNVLLSNEGDAVTNTTQIYNYNNQSATFTVSGGNLIVNSLSSGNTICAVYTN